MSEDNTKIGEQLAKQANERDKPAWDPWSEKFPSEKPDPEATGTRENMASNIAEEANKQDRKLNNLVRNSPWEQENQ